MTTNKYPRGSEWRKWDLHVHTPASGLANGFNGDWDSYVKTLFTLAVERGVAVIGITDYFTIEGYEKITNDYIGKDDKLIELFETKEMVDKVKSILLLPNIEFRLDKLVNSNRVNYHIIFSNEVSIKDIKENFLQEIEFVYESLPFSKDNTRKLTRYNIEELGKKIKTEQTTFSGSDFEIGCTTAIVQDGQIREILNSHSDLFKDKYLIAIPVDEDLSAVDWNSQGHLFRKVLYQQSNIFFTSNKSTIEFGLGEKHSSEEEYLQEFKSFKPCLIGSDAHSLEVLESKLGRQWTTDDDTSKTTWIKADPTFEGLKQVIYEPRERVRIQTTIPDDKNIYQVLDKVVLNEEGFWNGTIHLNPNLNTIIGGRSTGKSTLLKAIAAIHNPNSVDSDDFIMKHLGGVTIQWKDGTDQIGREIEYFKQSYMHDIASDASKTSELIESIIRNKDTSGILSMYYAHLNDVSRKITEQMFSLFQTSKELSEKRKELTVLGKRDGVVQQIHLLKAKVNELQKASKITIEQQALFDASMQKIKELSSEIEKADNDLKILERLLQVTPFDYSFEEQWQMDKLSFRLNQYDLLREFKNLKIRTEQEFIALVRKYQQETIQAKNEIQEQCRVIKESDTYINGIIFIEGNKELKDINDRITTEEKKLSEIDQLQTSIDKIKNECNRLFISIISLHCSLKIKAEEVEKVLNISYDGLSITVKVEHHRDALQHFLEDRLNLRGNERQDYFNTIVRNYDIDNSTYSKDFLKKLLIGELQLKNGYDSLNVATEFFTKSWYSIGFELCYQGDSFKQMSEGKQAFVILKLLLDFSEKKCPILIDQPEDSLDNRAIYKHLVTYIKKKKKERQIILVTHNSNVVVSADAENVIVANQEGSDSHNIDGCRFQYVNGALENTSPRVENCEYILKSQGIKEHVCEILEGGVDAFKKREQKYGI